MEAPFEGVTPGIPNPLCNLFSDQLLFPPLWRSRRRFYERVALVAAHSPFPLSFLKRRKMWTEREEIGVVVTATCESGKKAFSQCDFFHRTQMGRFMAKHSIFYFYFIHNRKGEENSLGPLDPPGVDQKK